MHGPSSVRWESPALAQQSPALPMLVLALPLQSTDFQHTKRPSPEVPVANRCDSVDKDNYHNSSARELFENSVFTDIAM